MFVAVVLTFMKANVLVAVPESAAPAIPASVAWRTIKPDGPVNPVVYGAAIESVAPAAKVIGDVGVREPHDRLLEQVSLNTTVELVALGFTIANFCVYTVFCFPETCKPFGVTTGLFLVVMATVAV